MNTATFMAAALLGYTWGHHPLDDRSTEFLIQMSIADIDVMADGQSEIVVDVPSEAGPVGRVRIIVGNEQLPREALPSFETGDERTAARPAQPAIAFAPDQEPTTTGPYLHLDSPEEPALELGGRDRYGNRALPPLIAPLVRAPRIDRGAPEVPVDDVMPPALGAPDFADRHDRLGENHDPPFGLGRSINEREGIVDAPPATSPHAYPNDRGTELSLDDSTVRNPVVTNVGPSLVPIHGNPAFDWGRVADSSVPPSETPEMGGRPLSEPNTTAQDHSPSESGSAVVAQRRSSTNASTTSWRSWTLVTGPVAFGLFWLKIYQWGTYKSLRQRYLSLLRRTGEV